MNIKPSMQNYFPCQIQHITWRNTAIHVTSEHPHFALYIYSHKYTDVFYIRIVSPLSTRSISKLSGKSGLFFHTHIRRFYYKCLSAVIVSSLSPVRLFCDPMDLSPAGCSVHGILQARTLEWVAMSFSKGSSWHRNCTWSSYTLPVFQAFLYKVSNFL